VKLCDADDEDEDDDGPTFHYAHWCCRCGPVAASTPSPPATWIRRRRPSTRGGGLVAGGDALPCLALDAHLLPPSPVLHRAHPLPYCTSPANSLPLPYSTTPPPMPLPPLSARCEEAPPCTSSYELRGVDPPHFTLCFPPLPSRRHARRHR
jgi:hypothetical protein